MIANGKRWLILTTLFLLVLSALAQNQSKPPYDKIHNTYSDHQLVLSKNLQQSIEQNKKMMAIQGYIEKPNERPRIDFVADRIEEKYAPLRKQKQLPNLTKHGFSLLDNADFNHLSFQPHIVPKRFIEPKSDNYVMAGGGKIRQLYNNTFFGRLLFDESQVADANLGLKNMTLAGVPATFSYVKYRDDRWTTMVMVIIDDRYILVEADRKLEYEDKALFLNMISEAILPPSDANAR